MFCGVHGQGEGPEPVIVGSLWVVEEDLAGLSELVALYVEFVVEVDVERDWRRGRRRRVVFLRCGNAEASPEVLAQNFIPCGCVINN